MNLKHLVESVSRSFALTLLALPKKQKDSVALTYLLARFADTLTDSGKWAIDERLSHLGVWENAILNENLSSWNLYGSLETFKPEEARLLIEGDLLLEAFGKLKDDERSVSRKVLGTLMEGMRWDLEKFGHKRNSHSVIYGCENEKDFDWYCYSIAGCVGAYWVKIFGLNSNIESLAVSYGKGLQRINILRDVSEDWSRGRVYLPVEDLERFDLLGDIPWKKSQWKEFCHDYSKRTRELLGEGADFCSRLPYFSWRLKWASLMPLKIGLETLNLLERTTISGKKLKISRRDVKRLAFLTSLQVVSGVDI